MKGWKLAPPNVETRGLGNNELRERGTCDPEARVGGAGAGKAT